MRTALLPHMQKLALLLLPLAIAACVERDTVPANSAGTPTSTSYPVTAPPPPATTTGGATTATPATEPTRVPGRGEGELESPATTPLEVSVEDDVLPDGSIDGAQRAQETSDVERNEASSKESDAEFDPARHPAIIDESGAPGFGGQVLSPESLGDGELRPDDYDNEIDPDELPMLPADVVDAGPALIP